MKEYTQYELFTGQIIKYGVSSDEIFDVVPNLIEGAYADSAYYIVNRIATIRPILMLNKSKIIADGSDKVICTDLPIPFVVCIDGDPYEITDGIFEFSTNIPGAYIIEAKTFPYREEPIEIVAI